MMIDDGKLSAFRIQRNRSIQEPRIVVFDPALRTATVTACFAHWAEYVRNQGFMVTKHRWNNAVFMTTIDVRVFDIEVHLLRRLRYSCWYPTLCHHKDVLEFLACKMSGKEAKIESFHSVLPKS